MATAAAPQSLSERCLTSGTPPTSFQPSRSATSAGETTRPRPVWQAVTVNAPNVPNVQMISSASGEGERTQPRSDDDDEDDHQEQDDDDRGRADAAAALEIAKALRLLLAFGETLSLRSRAERAGRGCDFLTGSPLLLRNRGIGAGGRREEPGGEQNGQNDST